MTTLPERLQDFADDYPVTCDLDRKAVALLLEAATALQSSGGEVVAETMISHAREPHCIGCYVIRWNDGELVAQCNECGATVALLDGLASPAQPSGFVVGEDDVEWVVNDNAELGVRIRGQCFFLYKGNSLVYETAKHDDGTPMFVRTVGKREFGECCHPINYSDPSRIGTVSLSDSDRWEPLTAAPAPIEQESK